VTAAVDQKAPIDPRAAGQILVRSLSDRWRRYRRELKRCQKKYSEEAVHDLRVSTRRLMSTLELLATLVTDNRLKKPRRTLKKRLDMFDPLRDTQIQLLYVEKRLPTCPELQAVYDALAKQERQLVKHIRKQVKRLKTARLEKSVTTMGKQLRARLTDPTKPDETVSAMMSAVDAAFANVVNRRRQMNPDDTTTIHRTRVAFKKFRYMVEVLQPLLGEVTDERLKQMHDFQTMMGDIQDIEVLSASLKAFAQKKKPAVAKALLPTQRELARRRLTLIKTFMRSADELFTFWNQDRRAMRAEETAEKGAV
jgi:CHAD domain-containing protein